MPLTERAADAADALRREAHGAQSLLPGESGGVACTALATIFEMARQGIRGTT